VTAGVNDHGHHSPASSVAHDVVHELSVFSSTVSRA
jgi:hypothetical protein